MYLLPDSGIPNFEEEISGLLQINQYAVKYRLKWVGVGVGGRPSA